MKKICIAGCLCLALLLLLPGCAGKRTLTSVRLSEVTHSVFYAPQYVALEQGFFSGVDFIASVHAASAEEAVRRPQVKALQQQGMLRVLVLLQGCAEPGRVRQIDEL